MKEQYFEYQKELHKLLEDGSVWVHREEIDWDANKEDDERYDKWNKEEKEHFKENMAQYKAIHWFKRIFKKKPELKVWGNYYTPLQYKKEWVKSEDPAFDPANFNIMDYQIDKNHD